MNAEPEEELALDLSLVSVHLLTCPARAASCAATLARWDLTDWGKLCGRPRVHVDEQSETPEAPWGDARRGERIVGAFAKMLASASAKADFMPREVESRRVGRGSWLRASIQFPPWRLGGEPHGWLLLLEDDLEFHPRIGAAVASWRRLLGCGMGTLFNPGLRQLEKMPDDDPAGDNPNPPEPLVSAALRLRPGPCDFPTDPKTFLGAQALLLRVSFARAALARWNTVSGMQSQRLAALHAACYPWNPILVHRPSLVQHLPVEGGSGWGARVQQALDFNPSWSPPFPR